MNQPGLSPKLLGGAEDRGIISSISDGLLNTEKIQEEARIREEKYLSHLAPKKKPYLEMMLERRKRIQKLRQEMAVSNHELQVVGSKTAQELEAELLSLIGLGSLEEEFSDKDNSVSMACADVESPLLIQKSAHSAHGLFPGMWMAGGAGSKDFVEKTQPATEGSGSSSEKPTSAAHERQIDELCQQFSNQAQEDHSIRDGVLSAAGGILGALGGIVPPPFDSVLTVAQKVVSLAQTATTNTAESLRLAARVARLNIAMMKLSTRGDRPLAQRAANDLKKAFDDAVKLLQQFQPNEGWSFLDQIKAKWTQYSGGTVDSFKAIHEELTIIMNDRAFALSLEDRNRLQPPTLDEIKEGVRQELDHVVSEVKRVGEETGNRLTGLEDNLQQLLDRTYGSSIGSRRQAVILDPSTVKIDAKTVLGSGAFGVVRAGMLYGSTPVAIKELEHCSGNVAEALSQEVERMMRVSHPNVVKVYGLLCTKNSNTPNAIVMERLGDSLENTAKQVPLPSEHKMKYTQDIIAGMSRVHDSRLVHCDLKPANIMLTENRHSAKIIDFGISRGRSTIVFSDIPKSRGTVQYMAPEVLSCQKLGLSCDVYSFGVLLYELWSGQGAWENYSEEQIRVNVNGEGRPSNRERMLSEEGISAPIAALIEACWKQKPGDRPTFKEMQAILDIEDFWEAPESRWPSFLQSWTRYTPVVPAGGNRPGLPSSIQFEQFGCDALCQALQTLDIHEDILNWLKEKKYNGRQFVQAGIKMVEQLKSGQKADEIHIEDFEQVHQRVYSQYQEELQKAQAHVEAVKKAQLAAEKEAERTEAAKQTKAKEEAEKAAAQTKAREEEETKRRLAQEQADSVRKAEEAKRAESTRQEAERARLAAASRAANVARTTSMTADPLNRAGTWYKGPREAQSVRALEWELGRKGSMQMTFRDAQAYAASRSAEGWRLPTIWELEALYQQKSVLGDDWDASYFWSETPLIGLNDAYRWHINFAEGDGRLNEGASYGVRVRLVRG